LGAEERLASFSNPNTPLTGVFDGNAIQVPGYFANYGNTIGTGNPTSMIKLYTLPDQIDGMNYQQFAPTVYNSKIYTAQSNSIWKLGSTNNPWGITSGDIYIEDKLIIPSGKSITIENMTFRFAPEAKIIIEPGAKLTIDGGILTNTRPCNNEESYWRGVEVWGTSNQHQYPTNGSTYQGTLILKNGGTIEKAHIAATNWRRDDWNGIGGIIQATDGVFKNNRRDVEFMKYANFLASNPNTIVPNLSFFRNTDFVSDDNFIEKGYVIQKHVTLWEVSGINFTNCHFSNDITTDKSSSTAPNGAISSLNAGFKVLAGCSTSPSLGQACPTSILLKSSFSGFLSAVEIAGSSTTASVTVQQSQFTDNIFAIGVDEFDNVSINRNDIEIGNAGYTLSSPSGMGININNSTGYIIEENNVSTNLNNGNYLGINVTNGGEDDHQLYKNKLHELSIGTTAKGINHNTNYQKGLQFLCNEYKNNATAISILSKPLADGVRFYQGDFSPKKASGNTFINNNKDIINSANSIMYYHKGINSEPVNNSGLISIQLLDDGNTCPTNFGSGDIATPVSLLKSNLIVLTDDYNDLNFIYISQIDDGKTEQFKNNIEINWSDDAWHLREKLIEKSPYVSTDALLKAAEQNVLPNGMLLEVLLANPDATRGEAFIENLRNETNNTFPEYMLDFVRNNWDTQTLRTNLEGQMATIHSELSKTRNYIKYLEKSEDEYTLEERLTTMKIGNSISHKIGLMDFYIESNQFTKADSVYQATLTDPSTKNELNLIDYYDDYLTFRSSLSNRNLAQLDSSEIAYLQTLAENSGRAGGYAKNVLCFFYNICFEKEFPTEDFAPKSMLNSTNSPELEDIMYNITLYPNPSDEFASIKWEIYDQIQNASFKVFNLNGLEVMSNVIETNKGEKVIDTRSLKSGVYIVGIYNNDKIKVNKKLVVNPKK
jgi:hypothetical protein